MDKYLTMSYGRRERWQGHGHEANVRRVIQQARRDGRDVHVMWLDDSNPHATPLYYTIPECNWARIFGA